MDKQELQQLRAESAYLRADSSELIAYAGLLVQYSAELRQRSNRVLLQRLERNVGRNDWPADLLEVAMEAFDADFGRIQLFDSSSRH